MRTRDDILRAALAIRDGLARSLPLHRSALLATTIDVSARMTSSAGLAWGLAYATRRHVRLSLAFFADERNFDRQLANVVRHELAHVLAPHESRQHGPKWRAVARTLGLANPTRCHSMKLAEGFKARQSVPPIEVPCYVCAGPLMVKANKARAYLHDIQKGTAGPGTGFGWRHQNCKDES